MLKINKGKLIALAALTGIFAAKIFGIISPNNKIKNVINTN